MSYRDLASEALQAFAKATVDHGTDMGPTSSEWSHLYETAMRAGGRADQLEELLRELLVATSALEAAAQLGDENMADTRKLSARVTVARARAMQTLSPWALP